MLFTQLCRLAQEYSHWSRERDDKINNQWKYSLYDDVLSAVICFSHKQRNKMAASDQIKKELFKKGGVPKKIGSGNYFEILSIFGNFIWIYKWPPANANPGNSRPADWSTSKKIGGSKNLSSGTSFENPLYWCDYNNLIGAKSSVGSILKFLCLPVENVAYIAS